MVEAYTDSLPGSMHSCNTKPRSVCTGPPWNTGAAFKSSRRSGNSTLSNRLLRLISLGLLITRPRAPRSLCSHM